MSGEDIKDEPTLSVSVQDVLKDIRKVIVAQHEGNANANSNSMPYANTHAQQHINSEEGDDDDDILDLIAEQPESNMSAAVEQGLTSPESIRTAASEIRMLVEQIKQAREKSDAWIGGTTVEEMIIKLVKPQLSEWLNNNLHNIVREIVEKEIQRIVDQN